MLRRKIKKHLAVRMLFKLAEAERARHALFTYVRGGRECHYNFSLPALSGTAELGDTIRIPRSGATGKVCIVEADFVGADFGICYSENKHGDYEVIQRAVKEAAERT